MSKDFQIAFPCPHMAVEEISVLGTDRRSLPTSQPIGNASSVRILVNDEYFVPQGGLSIPARIFSAFSGPFILKEGQDSLTIETPKGSFTTSFGIVGTNQLTTDQIIRYILKKGFDIGLAINSNGYLEFGDVSTVGPDSYVRIAGSAATALGFGEQDCGTNGVPRSATGKNLYPGWLLYTPPGQITAKFPRFVLPVKTNPIFKLTYATSVNRCLRCQATYVENDYRFDPSGLALMVENENLLYQAALKILLTEKGSNIFHPWYGSTITTRIGSKALSGVASLLNEDVRQALIRFQKLQEGQAKYQTVTFKERLYTILNVNVYPHAQDPTTYMIDVTVQNASAEPIELTIVFTVPSVVALMGSNGLTLGTEKAGITTINIPNSPIAMLNNPTG